MPIPVLYEFSFAVGLLLLAAVELVIVLALRLLLRRWRTLWAKTLVVHALAIPALFVAFYFRAHVFLPTAFMGTTNGDVLTLGGGFMLADGLRAWLQSRAPAPGRQRWLPWLASAAVVLLFAGMTRVGADAEGGRQALHEHAIGVSAHRLLVRGAPGREIMPALAQAFPAEANSIVGRYRAQAIADYRQGERLAPKFPFRDIDRLIEAHADDIVRAPDAALHELAKTLPGVAQTEVFCPAIAASQGQPHGLDLDAPAPEEELRRLGVFTAAQLRAARAGIDNPAPRQFTAERTASLFAEYVRRHPGSALQEDELPLLDSCEEAVKFSEWIASLSPTDSAYMMAGIGGGTRVGAAKSPLMNSSQY